MALTVNYNDEGVADCVPTYLFDQAATYRESPHDAALEWFANAIFGLSVHFGLSALLGKGENPVGVVTPEQYKALPKHFHCEHFDTTDIVELTIAAGARYLLFPAVLPDGFCLFNTATTEFHSAKSAAQRNLVAEMASTCEYHGIGLFLEYSFGQNADRYPDGIQKGLLPQTEYTEFVKSQLKELLTEYGPIAGICLTGLETIGARDPAFDVQDIYDMIRFLQPNTLISFREGFNGQEDFFSVADKIDSAASPLVAQNATHPIEIRRTLCGGSDRGFLPENAGKHRKTSEIWEDLRRAHSANAQLLLNTALLPDGSLDLEDIKTLLEVGERLEKEGRP